MDGWMDVCDANQSITCKKKVSQQVLKSYNPTSQYHNIMFNDITSS